MAPLMHMQLGPARKLLRRKWTGARACNLAIWRSDLDLIDGFDSSYVGWGLEDSDLLIRLLRAGVQRKDGRFATGVLHLWHPLADATQLSSNQSRLEAIQRSTRIRAVKGMSLLQELPERVLSRSGPRASRPRKPPNDPAPPSLLTAFAVVPVERVHHQPARQVPGQPPPRSCWEAWNDDALVVPQSAIALLGHRFRRLRHHVGPGLRP